ncbi:ADP-ribose pyrophosphatase, mitochondrial isoform X3 [Daktulosphaira vitifoliae]|uniref:ADP-ribose pyrophosphatase, mitochondrial isoform X3 n=1 Tax=Daktulosphaira vitifoliae TaxID=58002 RepID=UPI0021AAEAC9|nr:ADP-ribose pyrophosphatase, mitochondrial isoform X3 [Daktulosphaira vitifoliae]XP_050534802.1 ADP-ribose pyrophosphatase, mitochondrial isoform X3 [Daktulosphaira vitifoliae]
MTSKIMLHMKCRNNAYPKTDGKIIRFPVPDNKVSWFNDYLTYKPIFYTALSVLNQKWADLDLNESKFKPVWNNIDGNINRISFTGNYMIKNNFPLNPYGRTGLVGRGLLGRWGPNHAADPIVTRWKKNHSENEVHIDTGKPILQFVAIKRKDSGEWALPGGMVDCGEIVSTTLKREFMEETMNLLEKSKSDATKVELEVENIFKDGIEIYKGYVDDPRNTDNAWIETVATLFHDEKGDHVSALKLHAGDDAVGVKWIDLDNNLKLYANHLLFLQDIALKLKCHW